MNRARQFGLSTVIGLALLLAGCNNDSTQSSADSRAQSPVVRASLLTLKTQPLPIYATFPGSVQPADQVQVASRLTGNISKVYVHEGETVQKGQLLLSIDPTDVKAQIEQAKGGLRKAEAALADAKANFVRYRDLYQQQAVPKQKFQQIELAYRVAEGNLAAARAGLATARSQLTYADVRAPFSGVVVSKQVDAGQLATPGQPLLTLQSSGHQQVQVQVDSRAYAHLRLGQQLPVLLDTSDFQHRQVTGTVERLVSAADPQTHTHLVKIGLAADSGANSGSFARVRVPLGSEPGILVPESALQRRADTVGVFVVGSDQRAQFRMLRLGNRDGDQRVVLAGLVPGEQVAVSNTDALFNGARVQADTNGN